MLSNLGSPAWKRCRSEIIGRYTRLVTRVLILVSDPYCALIHFSGTQNPHRFIVDGFNLNRGSSPVDAYYSKACVPVCHALSTLFVFKNNSEGMGKFGACSHGSPTPRRGKGYGLGGHSAPYIVKFSPMYRDSTQSDSSCRQTASGPATQIAEFLSPLNGVNAWRGGVCASGRDV